MPWQPPPRPEWVEAVNSGLIVPMTEEASRPLSRDDLLGEARARLGLDVAGSGQALVADFGSEDFLEPLDVLLPALEEEARLTVIGRWLTRRFLLRLLEVRLQLVAYARADPGVLDEEIAEPWFVTGAPRTGTTILHSLLAQDERHRVPVGWELLRPVPPPDPGNAVGDPRIPLADFELRMPSTVVEGIVPIHEYTGTMYKECVSSMSFSFRSEEFTARYDVPSYVEWLQSCDMVPAYEAHKLVLQVLQRGWLDRRWVLKSPVHLHSIPALRQVYPDARIAVTHRDPLAVLASVTSLVANLRWAHSDHVDFEAIGRYHVALYHGDLDGLAGERSHWIDPARDHNSLYSDFVADPIGTVGGLYQHFGVELGAATAARMAEHLAQRPKDRLGVHEYSFADLGLDEQELRRRFAPYQEAFRVPVEPLP